MTETTSAPPPTPKYSVVSHSSENRPTLVQAGGDNFAVFALGCTQFKVGKGDIVNAERVPDAKVGEIIDLDRVLLLGSPDQTVVGYPYIPGVKVQARVEEQTVDEKVIVFKMNRRKNYRRKQGHRRSVTILRITDIVAPEF